MLTPFSLWGHSRLNHSWPREVFALSPSSEPDCVSQILSDRFWAKASDRERLLLAVCCLSPQHLMAIAAPHSKPFHALNSRAAQDTRLPPTATLSIPLLESKQWPQNTH